MNVLFVNRMMGVTWGGGENFDFQLAQGLEAMGHRVRFLTAAGDAVPAAVPTDTVRVPYLRRYMYQLAGRLRYVPGIIAEFDLQLFERAALSRISELIASRAVDVVQILALPRLARRLVNAGSPVPVAMRFPGPPAWFHTSLLRRLAASGVGLFSHGDTVSRLGSLGIASEEIPPGIDLARYGCPSPVDRAQLRQQIGAGPESLVIVSVGRMVPGKGHRFLVEAMAQLAPQLPSARLVLVGDGPLRAKLEQNAAAAGLGEQIVFTGTQPPTEVARWLAASDVFGLFSDYENYSNAVLEAMASNLPVLAPRLGGFPLQVRDGVNGMLITPGAHAQFVDSAVRLSSDALLRGRLAAGARSFAETFSWRSTAARAAALYERLRCR